MRITDVRAWEVLDSRGHPTVRVRVEADEATGTFTVPAGASTGTHEAVERRDGGHRYGGLGVRRAVRVVIDELRPLVTGRDVTAQREIDEALVEFDGTTDLSRLGANAILGVSGAVAHTASAVREEPLYETLTDGEPGRLPLPMVNVLSGGLHAHGGLEIQDILVIPMGASTYTESLEHVWEVRAATQSRIIERGHRPLVADEGGFAPPFEDIDAAFALLEESVRAAGHVPGEDIAFAVDVAATTFYHDGAYVLGGPDRRLDRAGMIELVSGWIDDYPIVSIEDPLADDDWEGWTELDDPLGGRVQLLADDLVATNADRLERAADVGAASGVIVKPNQAGTVTRATDVIEIAAARGLAPVVSARSGETADTTIADLAVARDAGQIKIGSLARSERLAKYNRLLEIEAAHGGEFAGAAAITRL